MSIGDPTPVLQFSPEDLPKLGTTLSQRDPYFIPGDYDDCAPMAADMAARSVGGKAVKIPTFRAAANAPDVQGQTNGMTAGVIAKAAIKLWPKLRIKLSSEAWSTFVAACKKQEKSFAVMTVSGSLPKDFQFGVGPKVLHEIAGRYVKTTGGGAFYCLNPYAAPGTAPRRFTDAELKKAVMAVGKVSGVLFGTELASPPPAPDPVPEPPPAVDCHSQAELNAAYANGRADGLKAAKAALEGLS